MTPPQRWRFLARDERIVGTSALAAAVVVLVARLAPDLGPKPLYLDEAVSGLTAVRPFGEMVQIVIVERGGPPVHYLIAHVATALHPSATALRVVSFLAAIASVVVIYDLGRRLSGPFAGGTAALLAALSTFMGIHGTFGRPYAVFVLTSALALDLFVRALERRTIGATAWAALAAVLAASTHPYGFYVLVAEASAGLVAWRFRPARGVAIPAGAAILLIPVILSLRRLSERFDIGEGSEAIAKPRVAARQLLYALEGSAAGRPMFAVVALLVLGGLVVLARDRPLVAGVSLALFVAPPALYILVPSGSDGLSAINPRHLLFLLPVWVVLAGIGADWAGERLSKGARPLLLVALSAAAAFSQFEGIDDPRTKVPELAANGSPSAVRGVARFLEHEVHEGDVLYTHSPSYLAALSASARGTVVDAQPGDVLKVGLERVSFPASGVIFSAPRGSARLDRARLTESVGAGNAHVLGRWVVVRMRGPFADEAAALNALVRAVGGLDRALLGETTRLAEFLERKRRGLCDRLVQLAAAQPEGC